MRSVKYFYKYRDPRNNNHAVVNILRRVTCAGCCESCDENLSAKMPTVPRRTVRNAQDVLLSCFPQRLDTARPRCAGTTIGPARRLSAGTEGRTSSDVILLLYYIMRNYYDIII